MSLLRLILIIIMFTLFYYATMLFGRPGLHSELGPTSELCMGLSLTANHGTISIRRSDGTFEDLGRVDGDESYLDLMKRLSLKSAQHPSAPHFTLEDLWDDYPRQFWRGVRKGLGLPASPDVAILSNMLRKLIKRSGWTHNTSPPSVVVSYAALPGLYQEDIADAAAYLKLRILQGRHCYSPHEIVAAYAGYGMGLCESCNNEKYCDKEEPNLPARDVMLVEYTEAALLLHGMGLRVARDLAFDSLDISTSFELGNADDGIKVRELILGILHRRFPAWKSTKVLTVIVTGSPRSIDSSGIVKIVEDTALDFGCKVNMLTLNPENIAARGAAELAWRALVRPTKYELR